MKISIITSTYNNVKQIYELYLSLMSQHDKVYEWIICDDHSSDMTANLVDNYFLHAPFDVYYVVQQNKGARYAKNLNNGIKLSTGDVLFFVNGDSYLERNTLQVLEDTYIQGSAGSALRIDVDGDKKFIKYDWRVPDGNKEIVSLEHQANPWVALTGNGMIVSRKDLEAVGRWNENYKGYGRDDWSVFLRLRIAQIPLYQYNNVRINHFYHGEGKEDSPENITLFIEELQHAHL